MTLCEPTEKIMKVSHHDTKKQMNARKQIKKTNGKERKKNKIRYKQRCEANQSNLTGPQKLQQVKKRKQRIRQTWSTTRDAVNEVQLKIKRRGVKTDTKKKGTRKDPSESKEKEDPLPLCRDHRDIKTQGAKRMVQGPEQVQKSKSLKFVRESRGATRIYQN